jgi:holliday junction DNA helicase RuvA
MIGWIQGVIQEKQAPQLVVEVGGIGYEIDAPMSTFYHLPAVGHTVSLFTHFIVREDAQCLYGFYTREERLLFRTLLKVNGIGPRLALTILSSIEPTEFACCVLANDTANLIRIPGIGKKTAERLVVEIRDKLSDWYTVTEEGGHLPLIQSESFSRHQVLQDAISALVVLGYKQSEAGRAVAKIDDGIARSEELIRRALQEMVS